MKKDLSYYLNLEYPITITKDIDEGKTYFVAEIPDLPGCGAQGESIEEAIRNLEEAKNLWIEISFEKGYNIPEPVTEDEFSGKFLLRIPPKLHMRLTLEAKKEGVSLNQYIKRKLEKDLTLEPIEKELKEIREKINELARGKIVISSTQFEEDVQPATLNDANLDSMLETLPRPKPAFGSESINFEGELSH